jgi:hypothetical protein
MAMVHMHDDLFPFLFQICPFSFHDVRAEAGTMAFFLQLAPSSVQEKPPLVWTSA